MCMSGIFWTAHLHYELNWLTFVVNRFMSCKVNRWRTGATGCNYYYEINWVQAYFRIDAATFSVEEKENQVAGYFWRHWEGPGQGDSVSFRFLYLTKLQYFVCLCFTQMSCSCNFLVHTVGSIDHFWFSSNLCCNKHIVHFGSVLFVGQLHACKLERNAHSFQSSLNLATLIWLVRKSEHAGSTSGG